MANEVFPQIASLAGAFLILVAYFLLETRRAKAHSVPYLMLNFIGGLLLFYAALVTRKAGFILLEGSWTAISLYGLIKTLRKVA